MKPHYRVIAFFLLVFLYNAKLLSQPWDFVKETDGIIIYTRNELNTSLKAFRGEITFMANIEKVNLLIGDANNLDWWVKDVVLIKVLNFKKDEFIHYYLVYKVPWPLSNRDLTADVRISHDTLTGMKSVIVKPLPNTMPEKPGLVRVEKFWEKWTITPLDKRYVKVIFEGFFDPNGNVPSWLYNMVVTDTPLKVLQNLRARAISDKPVNNP